MSQKSIEQVKVFRHFGEGIDKSAAVLNFCCMYELHTNLERHFIDNTLNSKLISV